jgi:hypothetical protein
MPLDYHIAFPAEGPPTSKWLRLQALLVATTPEIKPAPRDNQRTWNRKMAVDCKSSEAETWYGAGNLSACLCNFEFNHERSFDGVLVDT